MHHKDKRRINGWLKQLKELDFVAKYEDTISASDKTKPAIFHLSLNGIRFLMMQGIDPTLLHKLYRERQRSVEFINHSLLLANIFLNLKDHTAKEDSFTFYTQSDYFQTDSPYQFLKELAPDIYLTRKIGKEKTKQYLLHVIPESMLRFRSYKLPKKIKDYLSFYFTNSWENQTKTPFPTLLFILPDMAALINLQRYIQRLFNENNHPKIHIWLATKAEIQQHGFTGTPWEEVN